MGRQVIDKTGFTGRFDLDLEYSRELAPVDPTTTAPSIVTVSQDEVLMVHKDLRCVNDS
jgi:uncharacterized protein (TIGR03435 family)